MSNRSGKTVTGMRDLLTNDFDPASLKERSNLVGPKNVYSTGTCDRKVLAPNRFVFFAFESNVA